jgi:hypothetical protein
VSQKHPVVAITTLGSMSHERTGKPRVEGSSGRDGRAKAAAFTIPLPWSGTATRSPDDDPIRGRLSWFLPARRPLNRSAIERSLSCR